MEKMELWFGLFTTTTIQKLVTLSKSKQCKFLFGFCEFLSDKQDNFVFHLWKKVGAYHYQRIIH